MVNIDDVYPEDLQKLFVDRLRYLDILKKLRESLKEGARDHLALMGLRRIGKTLILKEFLRRNWSRGNEDIAYIDLQRMDLMPELFARQFVGSIAAWHFREGRIEDYYDLDRCLSSLRDLKGSYEFVLNMKVELGKAEYSYPDLLRMAFQFPEIISKETGKRIIVVLDEFQEILDLNNYKNVDIARILRSAMQIQSNTCYVFSGSAMRTMETIFKDRNSPLYLQARVEHVGYLTKEDSIELAKRMIRAETKNLEYLYTLTRGHPFYIYAICKRIEKRKANAENIKRAFLLETLTSDGRINSLCDYLLETSLGRARGSTQLKTILRIVASEGKIAVGELGRRIRRNFAVARSLVNRLKDVDLLEESDGYVSIPDHVLRYWLVHHYGSSELSELRVEKSFTSLIKELEEKYLRAKTELGRAKEYEFKYKLEKKFGVRLENYRKEVEFDLVGEKGGTAYIFEIKWRNRAADYREVERFLEKVERSEFARKEKTIFFVSKGGFTPEAEKLARERNVEIINEEI